MLEGPALAWLVVAIVAAIIEVSIPHFGCVFISAGALAAAAAAALSAGLSAQLAVFAVVLILSFGVLRRRLVTRLGGPGVPTRTEHLIGKDAVVTQDIDPVVGAGRVNVGGEDWAARSIGAVASGTQVRIVGADGIVLKVTRI